MNTKKKILMALALVGCAVLLVAGSIAGTLAYLTSTATVTNTFTVGNVAITMDETDVDVYGVKDGDARVTTNEYKLIPGRTYTKDPTIKVDANSEKCYIFFTVDNGLGTDATLDIGNKWIQIGTTGVYYYNEVATPGQSYVTFSSFTVAGTAIVDNYKDAKITVTGYAIQADGFDTAEDAWTAAKSAFDNN